MTWELGQPEGAPSNQQKRRKVEAALVTAKAAIALNSEPFTVAELVSEGELRRLYFEHVLRLHSGNKSAAARAIGIDRRTLYRRYNVETKVVGVELQDRVKVRRRRAEAPTEAMRKLMSGELVEGGESLGEYE